MKALTAGDEAEGPIQAENLPKSELDRLDMSETISNKAIREETKPYPDLKTKKDLLCSLFKPTVF